MTRAAQRRRRRPHTITREVRLPHPMARLVPLFERCRALLDRWTLTGAGVRRDRGRRRHRAARRRTGRSARHLVARPAAADAAFARLRAELGPDAIVVARSLADEHRPERAEHGNTLGDDGESKGQRPKTRGHAAESRVPSHDSRRVPAALANSKPRSQLKWNAPTASRASCGGAAGAMRIERPAGPERLAGDWWKDPYTRDYWRCEDRTARARSCSTTITRQGGWFVQGWYD